MSSSIQVPDNSHYAPDELPLSATANLNNQSGNSNSSSNYVPDDDYDLEAAARRHKEERESSFATERDEALQRVRTAGSISISPELFEKLYLTPKKTVKGDLRQTFGNPTPLALMGHILSICPLGCDLIGWKGAGQFGAASTGGFVFVGGVLLLLSGILEFFLGNTFSFVVFSSFGAFWLSFAGVLIPSFNSVGAYSPTGDSQVLGLNTTGFQASLAFYLLFWSLAVLILLICALRTNIAFVLLFVFLDATFISLTIAFFLLSEGQFTRGTNVVKAGGALALATGLVGFYIFLVLMLVAVDFPFLLPVGDLSHLMKGYQQKHGPLK
ncbi:GPR1/FUN34/yaaH family-domain-containing protein [Lipomyces japonicus]|uniref:GPR1/FUN34/yaaH family-domain-containing protein n=1 Tax=Lipomyces japonicus TaxID=56871 RepID=UPI0034CD8F56